MNRRTLLKVAKDAQTKLREIRQTLLPYRTVHERAERLLSDLDNVAYGFHLMRSDISMDEQAGWPEEGGK